MDFSIDKGLLNAAVENLENSISEHNARYGYLGADWDREVRQRFEAGEWVSFRVYYEGLVYSCDVRLEKGQWSPDTYLCKVAEEALRHAIGDGRIENPMPVFIEQTF